MRTHKIVMLVRDCGAHEPFTNLAAHFAKVVGENQLKNQAVTKLTRGVNDLVPDWEWYFDENRILHLHSLKLTATEEKDLAQKECDSIARLGKVVIE